MKRALIAIAVAFASMATYAQQPHFISPGRSNIAFGSRKNADSTRVASFNLGLWSQIDTLRGFQLQLGASGLLGNASGVNIGGLMARTMGNLDGVQAGGIANLVAGRMRGLQVGGFNVANEQRGVQVALLSNLTMQPLHGVQVALTNITRGMRSGVQLGGWNITSGDQRGAQAGIYNYADTLCGLQLGLINVNARNPKGFQLGLLNISGDTRKRRIGLVNVNPNTDIRLMAFAGNYDKFTAAVRFRNKSTYNIVSIGSFHSGLGTQRYSGSIGYRLGQYFNLTPRWSVSGDIGYSHIETFREATSAHPERLYSWQWRLNVDYQFNRWFGAFISGGYGQTRWYNHHRKFRDKPIIEAGLTVNLKPELNPTQALHKGGMSNHINMYGDSCSQVIKHPSIGEGLGRTSSLDGASGSLHPWHAAAEVVGINLFVQTFDRFVLRTDYSNINPSTLARNFRNGFVWDNDYFSTNQFAHPYHGNLYFNAARTNGMNFWQSYPYALGGSLMWEFWGETDPPAINDVFSTSFGGAAIGEVFYRTSSLILDDSKAGMPRFWRELAAGLLNPIRAFNRIIHGDAWRLRPSHNRYHDYNRIPVDASLLIGGRYVADEGHMTRGSHNLRLGFHLEYGDAFADERTVPYDYFSADVRFDIGAQPFVSDIHLIGRLYGHTIYEGQALRAQFGIFQHFDYYASDSIKGSDMKNPFEISETAAFGPGVIMQLPGTGNLTMFEQRLFLNGIILGGSKSDYYNFLDRDYNIGSGFGWKTNTRLVFGRLGMFSLNLEYYRLWTWKGFEKKDYTAPDFDAHFLNAQGDKSNAQLFVVSPRVELRLAGGWHLLVNSAFYNRITQYHYHANKHSHTYEITVGATYHF